MLGRQAFDPRERRSALVCQEQRMRAAVPQRSNPLRPTPGFQLIQQSYEASPLDVQSLGNFRLGPTRIGADQDQGGILGGTHVPSRKRGNEIVEDCHLKAAQEETHMAIQRV
jgi:hypothetical protein